MHKAQSPTSLTEPETFKIINPATEKIIAQIKTATPEQADQMVKEAACAQAGPWSQMPARERGRILLNMASLIRNRRDELAQLETENTGKPIRDSRDEVSSAADCFEYYGGAANKFFGETIPVASKGLGLTLREPMGVVAAIVPWNYPLVLASWKAAPALACGNSVVLKPASWTPLTALALKTIADEAGLPKGIFHVLVGPGKTVGMSLISNPWVSKISLTGETNTGKEVLKIASERMKRVSLELGGKSPNIVFDDVDIEACVESSIFSVFSNCGQDCCARSRFLVSEKIYDRFADALIQRTRQLKIGDPNDPATEIGPMITQSHRQQVLNYIEIGRQEKAELAHGGTISSANGNGRGYYLRPAIFTGVSNSMRIFREEIFGPVVGITPFKDETHAISLANDTIYGLSGSIWTKDIARAIRVARAVKSGVLSVNSSSSVHLEAPFGGYKQSGLGRELGMKAMDNYSEIKTIFFSET
ncbi:MAG: aldehyde dehydrogenase [Elusimicrobia bacterium]|nr:aldehyde dehydrogenase [Elusimicrobiota bacterium]